MPMFTARVRRLALIQDRGSVCRGVGNLVILCEPVGSLDCVRTYIITGRSGVNMLCVLWISFLET